MNSTLLAPSECTPAEERANIITHGLGAVLSVGGLALMAPLAAIYGDVWVVVGCCIFGATMIVLYSASTIYHCARSPRVKQILRVFDHQAIFLLIAGTYTPFTLTLLRGAWGWTLFGIVWGAALIGILGKAALFNRIPRLSMAMYLIMGWIALIAIKPILVSVPPVGLWLMLLGGIAYTGGVPFYLWRRLPYNHAIWHGFVLAGTGFHFFAILFSVVLGNMEPVAQ